MSHRCNAQVCRQLTAIPTAGEDCGVRTTQRSIRWSSCGKVFATVKEIRQWMGKPTGATNPPDWLAAMQHPDLAKRFAKVGLQPPVAKLRGVTKRKTIIGSPLTSAVNALENNKLVCVAENYLPWHGTDWSGSATFTGNHAVSYFGIEGDVGQRTTTRYDSLADGRYPYIAKGPDVVPFHIVADAMGKLDLDTSNARRPLGHGLWAGMVVDRAVPIEQPPAPPTCEQQLAEALAQLAVLTNAEDDDDTPPVPGAEAVEGVKATAAMPEDGPETDAP